jgi:hypothetical protein
MSPTYFQQCSKCGKGMGQTCLVGDWSHEVMQAHFQRLLCTQCERVKAWLPDIVAAVVEALREQATKEKA